jgi:tetratricopeptide (TPR) repeat protein
VRAGDWRALRKVLEGVAYDGASNAAAWEPTVAGEGAAERLALLFSDGLANWQVPGPVPAATAAARAGTQFTIKAAARADTARLRRLAEASGGRYLDLNTLTTGQALEALIRPALRLVDVAASGTESVVAASVHPESGRLALAGVLTAARARLTLTLDNGRGRRVLRHVDLTAPRPGPDAAAVDVVPLAALRWAQIRVAQLEGERQRHRAEIQRLGTQFRLLTAETSLIVLDRLADYERYDIVPPTGPMRAQFAELRTQRETASKQSRSTHVDALVRRFEEKQRWWARDFPKDTLPPAVARPSSTPSPGGAPPRPTAMAAMAAPPPSPAALAMAPSAVAERRASADASTASAVTAAAPATRIELRRWEPDAAYARRLREASEAERYAVYLDERPSHLDSTAFFIDAADIFFAKGQPALALRVLSNLAEMELENRHILRILAYRLQQAGQQALAIPLLERVRELAPDEPQSWRDLGLALADDGQPQRALDALWEVASRPWDARFSDIDIIALAELNALAARVPALDASRIDPRLRVNLPLDLRAVLSWDADNTDIDLWVIDPNGERAFYGHRLTYQGGAMSRDFTGGYGPEEFSLHLAKPGRYEVRAEFYGHSQQIVSPYTTLMLWLSTGFGTAGQKDERVVLRLSGKKEQVLVGTFEVAAPAAAGAASASAR